MHSELTDGATRGYGYTKCLWRKCRKRVLRKRKDQKFCCDDHRRDWWTEEMRSLRKELKDRA